MSSEQIALIGAAWRVLASQERAIDGAHFSLVSNDSLSELSALIKGWVKRADPGEGPFYARKWAQGRDDAALYFDFARREVPGAGASDVSLAEVELAADAAVVAARDAEAAAEEAESAADRAREAARRLGSGRATRVPAGTLRGKRAVEGPGPGDKVW